MKKKTTTNKHNLILIEELITRRRSFAEYWKHFVARFNDVHASGYNSAGSVRIRMKFGVLRVYCLPTCANNIEPSFYGNDAPYVKLLWPLVIFGHAHLVAQTTDSQALPAEYCIMGIPTYTIQPSSSALSFVFVNEDNMFVDHDQLTTTEIQ